jgi:uncharacterized RDD family membrane protein YckC
MESATPPPPPPGPESPGGAPPPAPPQPQFQPPAGTAPQQAAEPGRSPAAGGLRAGFWQRFGAYVVDVIFIDIVNVILVVALRGAGYGIGLLISIAYFSYFEGGSGQTPGKRLVGVRVVDATTGEPIGYGRGVIRWLGRILSGIVILLGYLWMLWDREKQCWHDKAATDVVVPVSAYS